jgi:hypothetical protein
MFPREEVPFAEAAAARVLFVAPGWVIVTLMVTLAEVLAAAARKFSTASAS